MTEKEFDSQVRTMEGKMYRMARSMLRSDFDPATNYGEGTYPGRIEKAADHA